MNRAVAKEDSATAWLPGLPGLPGVGFARLHGKAQKMPQIAKELLLLTRESTRIVTSRRISSRSDATPPNLRDHLVGGAISILKNDGVRQWEG